MFQAEVPQPTRSSEIRIEAFVESEDAGKAAERLIALSGDGVAMSRHTGTLATAARLIGATPLGDILIAELGASLEADLEYIRELTEAGSRVIVLGHRNDIATFRAIMAAGGQEYFPLPVNGDEDMLLGMLDRPSPPAAALVSARSIAVCGVSGGVGASAVAQNLATAYVDKGCTAQLDRDPEGRVALLDADLEFGSAAADLNVNPTLGLIDALQAPERVDRTFLDSTMAELLEGLHLYSAGVNDPKTNDDLQAGFSPLLRRLRRDFPTVIVDLPRTLLAAQPALGEEFDEIVFVLGPGFASVRNCSRLVERVGQAAGEPRLTYLLSRRREDAGLKPREIAQALSVPTLHELPASAADLSRASVKGLPLQRIARRGAYGRSIMRLLNALEQPAGKEAKPARKGLFARKGSRS